MRQTIIIDIANGTLTVKWTGLDLAQANLALDSAKAKLLSLTERGSAGTPAEGPEGQEAAATRTRFPEFSGRQVS